MRDIITFHLSTFVTIIFIKSFIIKEIGSEEIMKVNIADYLVESNKVDSSYNRETAVNYLITAMNVITEKEKALYKLDRAKNTVVWINLTAQLYQDNYNVAIREQFYDLNRTVGKKLVEDGIDRNTFKQFKKAIEAYINMLTNLETKINACL